MKIADCRSIGAFTLSQNLEKIVEPLCRWSINLGAVALMAIIVLVVVDVTLRWTFGKSFPGTIEIVQLLLIVIFFSGMGDTELSKKHINVDILLNKFSHRIRLSLLGSGRLLTLSIIAIICWQGMANAHYAWTTGTKSGMLSIPLWPFGVVTAAFMAVFALAVLKNLLEAIGYLSECGMKSYLLLIPGIIVVLFFCGVFIYPDIFIPFRIRAEAFGIISLLVMFILIFLQVHIGAAMALSTLLGMSYLSSPESALSLLGMTSEATASNYVWSTLPLFMCLGILVASSRLSRDLYRTFYSWLGHLRGGLACATVGACSSFAAVVGDPMSGAVTMSTVALPEMESYKYDIKLATGAIAAGSSIGTLIPPSLGFIVYGIMTEQSIGRLFIAGIIPGILLTIAFILLIYFRCLANPIIGPQGPKTKLKKKFVSTAGSWPVMVLFLLVIGGIYGGIFTATEAGAIGAFCAMILGMAMGRLDSKKVFRSVTEAVQMAAIIFFVFIYATVITQYLAITKLPFAMADFVGGLSVPPIATIFIILFMYLVLGCLMNSLPVIILTLPMIFPIVQELGFDPIWFGVLVVMMTELGVLTPPIGITIFALAGVTQLPMYTLFIAVIPYWLVMILVIIILIFFPQISLFLPNLMMGG